MDEIPRTYYPGRGFLSDQEAYPTDLYGNVRPPNLKYDPTRDGTPQIIPLPYPVPMPGNQGNNQGGFNIGRAVGALAGSLGMAFGNPAFTPGPILSGRYSDLMKERNERINSGRTPGIIPEPESSEFLSQLPAGEQGPAQGPNTPIQMYPGMGYGPVGPAGGGLPPTPMPDLAEMPRFIRGNYRPGGVFGSPPPNLDSPFMDERIKRGFVPMTPPPSRGGGPQLPGFV